MIDRNLQIIAGVLALFFLAVAIVKSLMQRARKREAAARAIEQANSVTVSLHNPYPNGVPLPQPEQATSEPAQPDPTPTPASAAAPDTPSPQPPPPSSETVYKWN